MAGDWIKMRVDLLTHPKVVRMASALKADRLRTVGGLMAVWCLFDAHSVDGNLDGYTLEALDDLIGWKGFARAMKAIDWLQVSDGYLTAPRFDEHMSKSAKRRANDAERKRNDRKTSASDADAERTREREEKEKNKRKPPNPRKRGSGDRFADFWLAWPQRERKQDKAKCLDHWRLHELDTVADAIVADVRVKRGTEKWKEGYDEAPLTYLRGKRWEDGVVPNEAGTAVDRGEWWETQPGCEQKAATVGLPPWSQLEPFDVYRQRVRSRVEEGVPA